MPNSCLFLDSNIVKSIRSNQIDMLDALIWWIGAAAILSCVLQVVFFILKLYFGFFLGPLIDLKSFGQYACITGSTDGIGKAYAVELASKGLNLILLSRNQERLDSVATEIKRKHKIDVITLAVDFTKPNIYSDLETQLKDIDIGVLVNNVGMASTHPRYFWEMEPTFIQEMINCNFLSAAIMSRLVYPQFVAKSKGILINVSSTAAMIPGCLASVYCATKLSEQVFSSALKTEASFISDKIFVQDVAPCFVATKLADKVETFLHIPSPTSYVSSAINTIGRLSITTGCISHEIEKLFMNAIPGSLLNRLAFYFRLRDKDLIDKKSQ